MRLTCEVCGATGDSFNGNLGPGYIGVCCFEHARYLCTACYRHLGGMGQVDCPINDDQLDFLMITNLQTIEENLR